MRSEWTSSRHRVHCGCICTRPATRHAYLAHACPVSRALTRAEACHAGSPEAGNFEFTQAFRALVGRQMRFIHQLDVVPYLPGLATYAAVPFGTWIPSNSTVVLEDRPPEDANTLNWCDANPYPDPAPLYFPNSNPNPARCRPCERRLSRTCWRILHHAPTRLRANGKLRP